MDLNVTTIALTAVAYLIGSIPFGLLIVRWVRNIDVRRTGSGNIGATNVRRAAGTAWGIVTLVCDALKGALPTGVGLMVSESGIDGLAAWVALAAVVGHMYPVYFNFKPGGKGVATALGCFAVLSPLSCGIALALFIGLVVLFRRVSAASMGAMLAMPVLIGVLHQAKWTALVAAIIAGLIVWRHKENIQRLLDGTEPPIGKAH